MRERRMKSPEDVRWDGLFEYAYLVFVGIVTLLIFRTTTMMTEAQIGWMGPLVPWVRLLLLVFVGAKLARERSWEWWELLLAAVFCGALLRSWQLVDRDFVPELILLFLGAHGVDFKKIAKVHFALAAAALLVTMALALGGPVENLVFTRGDRRRMAFGLIYPTDFSARVFFLAAAWAWIRERRITLWEIGAIFCLGVFCLVFCDARNSVACLVLLAAGLLYLKLRRHGGVRRERPYGMTRPVQWLLVLAAPILAAGMIFTTRFYTNTIPWLDRLDDLLSIRLSVGHRMFERYGVTLFGQDVYMSGLGGTDGAVSYRDYAFLDCSYVNILLCFGLVTLLAVLGVMVAAALRERRLGAWERLGILALVALHCAMEHHLLEVGYNLFLLLPLAVSEPGSDKKPAP